MPNIEPQDNFDAMLASHLHQQLDGQLGKAAAAFGQSIHHPASRYAWAGQRFWPWAAGLAAAAAITLMFFLPKNKDIPRRVVTPVTPPAIHTADNTQHVQVRTEQVIANDVYDGGIMHMPDGTPVHGFYQRYVRQTRIYDPLANTVIENTQPQDQVILIGLNHY